MAKVNLFHNCFLKYLAFCQNYDSSLGIVVEENTIQLSKIRKTPKRIKIITEMEVQLNDSTEICHKLLNLIMKKGIKSTYCTLVIPQKRVLIKIQKIPCIPHSEILSYLKDNYDLFLPQGLSIDDFTILYSIISEQESTLTIIIYVYRKVNDSVMNGLGIILADTSRYRRTKIPLFRITYPYYDFMESMRIMLPGFSGWYVHKHQENYLMALFDKSRISCKKVFHTNIELIDFMNFQKSKSEPIAFVFSGDIEKDDLVKNCSADKFIFSSISEKTNTQLEKSYLAGLTPFILDVKKSYTFFPEEHSQYRNNLYKHLEFKSFIYWGGILTLIILFSGIIHYILLYKLSKSPQDKNQVEPLQVMLDSLRKNQLLFQKILENYQVLLTKRSYISYYLFTIGQLIQQDMWLVTIAVNSISDQLYQIHMTGLCRSEQNFSQLLDCLEEIRVIKNFQIIGISIINRNEVGQKLDIKSDNLIKFELMIYV